MTHVPHVRLSEPHRVFVHHLRTSTVADAVVTQATSLLSASERARGDRFHFARDRRQHVLFCALARRVLAHAVGESDALARAIVFSAGAHGRPEIAAPDELRGMRFNLSKTAGLVVCAVTETLDIGVDVENLGRSIDVAEVATVALHPREQSALEQLGDDERRLAFLKLWTLKEAYAKARGLGLFLPVEQLAFQVDGERVSAHFDARLGDHPREWTFHVLEPTAVHHIALVVQATERALDVALIDAAPLFDVNSGRARPSSGAPRAPLSSRFEVAHGTE
jgi:4'-phosphopantetheinyl transferase